MHLKLAKRHITLKQSNQAPNQVEHHLPKHTLHHGHQSSHAPCNSDHESNKVANNTYEID